MSRKREKIEMKFEILRLCRVPKRSSKICQEAKINNIIVDDILKKHLSSGLLLEISETSMIKHHAHALSKSPKRKTSSVYLLTDKGRDAICKFEELVAILNSKQEIMYNTQKVANRPARRELQ